GLNEIEIAPAALLREPELPVDGAAAEYLQSHPLLDIRSIAIHGAQPVGAHGTGPLSLRAVHPEVRDERVLVAEEIDEPDLERVLVLESIFFWTTGPGGSARRCS